MPHLVVRKTLLWILAVLVVLLGSLSPVWPAEPGIEEATPCCAANEKKAPPEGRLGSIDSSDQ